MSLYDGYSGTDFCAALLLPEAHQESNDSLSMWQPNLTIRQSVSWCCCAEIIGVLTCQDPAEYKAAKDRLSEKKGRYMRGYSNKRRRSKRTGMIIAGLHNGKRRRRNRRDNIEMAVMMLVTVVLLFFSVRAVYGLIASQRSPDVAKVSGTDGAGLGTEGFNMVQGDIVTLAENIKDQVDDEPEPEDNGILIVIDPGHGGYDNGSNIDGIYEKEITLEISFCLAEKLNELGYRTLLLREDNDTHLFPEERVEEAENAKADAFVSIHLNTYEDDTSVSGIETWYYEKADGSSELARLVQKAASKATGGRDRGLKEAKDLIVVRDTTMPSCLIETGFLTNKAEREALMSEEYQNKLASGIAQGIDEFINTQNIGRENGESGTGVSLR